MQRFFWLSAMTVIAACSGTSPVTPDDQAIRDYVDVGELQTTDKIRAYDNDSWSSLSNRFAIYDGRRGAEYLLEFRRVCRELRDNMTVTPDRRSDNYLRAGVDTLRGCVIYKIYPLTEAQATEIRGLGEAPREGT